jgi:hypothetical protein
MGTELHISHAWVLGDKAPISSETRRRRRSLWRVSEMDVAGGHHGW